MSLEIGADDRTALQRANETLNIHLGFTQGAAALHEKARFLQGLF